MFKLCVFVALLSLAAAAPAPAPVPAPAPAPSVIAPGIWGPTVVAGPHIVAAPHIVSVVPAAVSHSAITQVHPSPVVIKSVHPWSPWVVG